jgi:hypothetical protein
MDNIECSFCGTSEPIGEGKGQFIAGPKVFICRDCVELTIEIFGGDPEWRAKVIRMLKAISDSK